MNLDLQAHIGHRINIEESVWQVREVIGIVDSEPAQVTINDLVLSERPLEEQLMVLPRLYCRDCDLYLVGHWEYAS